MSQKSSLPSRTSIYDYVSMHNLGGVNELLGRYGVPPQNNTLNASYVLKMLSQKKGAGIMKDIAFIHPDKELIQEFIVAPVGDSNACGCSGADGKYSNCSGGGCKCGGKCGRASSFTGENVDEDGFFYNKGNGANQSVHAQFNTMALMVIGAMTIFAVVAFNKK